MHRFAADRPLILGGVKISDCDGLEGHSDADVLCHALADALLGAIGERDIGHHFPNTDPQCQGMSSLLIVARAVELIEKNHGRLVNVDITIVAEKPKLAPHLAEMKYHLANTLKISPKRIGLKATTNEGMGWIGRGEGIAALAVASVILSEFPGDYSSQVMIA